MKPISTIEQEAKILLRLKKEFQASNSTLSEMIKYFGAKLRKSVESGYPQKVIVWDLITRWRKVKLKKVEF